MNKYEVYLKDKFPEGGKLAEVEAQSAKEAADQIASQEDVERSALAVHPTDGFDLMTA